MAKKKPFGGKAKKAQLQARKQRKRTNQNPKWAGSSTEPVVPTRGNFEPDPPGGPAGERPPHGRPPFRQARGRGAPQGQADRDRFQLVLGGAAEAVVAGELLAAQRPLPTARLPAELGIGASHNEASERPLNL